MGELLRRAWREPAPPSIATGIDCKRRRTIRLRSIEVNVELLSPDGDRAILGDHVGPRLRIIRVVVIRRHGFLSPNNTNRRDHHGEESKAQQKPTMNEAA